MKKKKLCLIASGLSSGGVESFIKNYFNRMNLKDFELYLIIHNIPNNEVAKEFRKLGFTILYVCPKKHNFIKSIKLIKKYMKEYQFDIVHSNLVKSNFLYLFYAKKYNVKLRIAHSHNSIPLNNVIDKVKFYFIQKLNLKYANYYFGCSKEALICGFGNKVFSLDNYKIVYNAIETNKFNFNKDIRNKLRNKLGLCHSDIVLGNIARFTYQKNHEFLIKVFRKLVDNNKNYKLLLIGAGELKDKIIIDVKNKELENNVIFLETTNKIAQFYSVFDLFVLPSRFEGLPVTIVEALSNGLKIFTSPLFSLREDILKNINQINLIEEEWVYKILGTNNFYVRKNIIENTNYDIDIAYLELEKIYRG